MRKPTHNSVQRKFKNLNKTLDRLKENIDYHESNLSDILKESEESFIKNILKMSEEIDKLSEKSSEDEVNDLNEKVLTATEFSDKLYEYNDLISESVSKYNEMISENLVLNENVQDDYIVKVNKMKTLSQKISKEIVDKIKNYTL